jgi:hypothetical protein
MPLFYDQVALGLVGRTRLEIGGFVLVNFIAWVLWLNALADWTPASQRAALPYFIVGTYLPALLLVLLKPNEGAAPPWLEWLRRHRPDTSRND